MITPIPMATVQSVLDNGFAIPALTKVYTYTPFKDGEEFELYQAPILKIVKDEGIDSLFLNHEALFGEFLARFEWTMTRLLDVPVNQRWTVAEMALCEKLIRSLYDIFRQKVHRTLIKEYCELKENFPYVDYLLSNIGFDYLLVSIGIMSGESWTDSSKGIFEIYYSSDREEISSFMGKYEIDYDPILWLSHLLARLNHEKKYDRRFEVMHSDIINDIYTLLIKQLVDSNGTNELNKLACCCHYLNGKIQLGKKQILHKERVSGYHSHWQNEPDNLTVGIIHVTPPPFEGGIVPLLDRYKSASTVSEPTFTELKTESSSSESCLLQ